MVYPEFSEANVVEPFDVPPEWQDGISIDPGLNNPLSCHWYARDGDGNVYVVYEHYLAKHDVQHHCQAIKDICQKLGWKRDKFGNIVALMDSAANQRTLNGVRSVAELFADNGITVDTRVNKSLYTGINKIKALLKPLDGPPKLYIFSNCVNMIREMKGYFWGDGETPIKKDDHAMDDLRYYVCSLDAKTQASKQQKSAIQLDKERLYKRLGRK